ncbi:MAG: VCBS repeat-containing protein [Armatimonadetes bacterium]|nr:VCBS repeat-containing protein [Armatimonadota bacterium]
MPLPAPRYHLAITLDSPRRFSRVPYSIEVDFDRIFEERGIAGSFDRFSVRVEKVMPDGKTAAAPFYLSESFLTANAGAIHWLIEDTDVRRYIVRFDARERGPYPPPRRVGLVGDGDCLRYNDGRLHPLHVGMHAAAIPVDWNGDGKTDIITPQIYSHALGSPWFCIRCFLNEGDNERPVYGEGIPLRVRKDGAWHPLEAGYCIDIADWDGDGLPDLLAFPYWGKEVSVYRNTGQRDACGLPVLELHALLPTGSEGQYTCLRAVDWRGDGKLSLLVGYIVSGETQKGDPLWFEASQEEIERAQWPRWYYKSFIDLYENTAGPGEAPRFLPSRTLKTHDGLPISFHAVSSFEMADWDGGGLPGLLAQTDSGPGRPGTGKVGIALYRNIGTRKEPVFEYQGRVGPFEDRSSLGLRKADTPAFRGFLAHPGSMGGKIRYFQAAGRDAGGRPRFRDRGFLLQRNAYLSPRSGYAQGYLSERREDSGLRLVTGCETGFIERTESRGSRIEPTFHAFQTLRQGGREIELLNGPFADPGSFMEAPLGQTAPMVIDWDCDGTEDLLAVIGPRLLFYRNRGTSARPILAPPVEIRADGDEPVMKHRNKPAVADWDGDGLPDIIGHDPQEKSLLFFRCYRDARTGELRPAAGQPLAYEDGSPVIPSRWHSYTKYFNAADWNGDGLPDLWVGTSDHILYLENTARGFRPPVRLATDGQPVSIGHHVSTPFPFDWDRTGKLDLLVSGESGLFHLFRRSCLEGLHREIRHTVR